MVVYFSVPCNILALRASEIENDELKVTVMLFSKREIYSTMLFFSENWSIAKHSTALPKSTKTKKTI